MTKLFVFIFLVFNFNIDAQVIQNTNGTKKISIDPFENIFLCKKNKIIKIEKSNNQRLEYNFSEYGDLTKIITRNPLRTTLFFKESQTIIFLDKNLNKLNLELKVQSLQNNIISDIEAHSNLIFLLSEKSNEICTYDFKKMEFKNHNSNIKIIKSEHLKLFLNNEEIVILNNEGILILDENLITKKIEKLKNCQRLFFNEEFLYLQIKDNLYKSSIMDLSNLFFLKTLPKNSLFYISENNLFVLKNNFFSEEKLSQ